MRRDSIKLLSLFFMTFIFNRLVHKGFIKPLKIQIENKLIRLIVNRYAKLNKYKLTCQD